MNPALVLALICMVLISDIFGQSCMEWREGVRLGELPPEIDESSGLAVSRKFPGRVYHVNDSGDAGIYFITNLEGRNLRPVRISGFKPFDVEALALANCGEKRECLFIGDIGDNRRERSTIELTVVEETEQIPSSVVPMRRVKLRYPDGPHDAESMAVHSSGAVFILTKSRPARLFKLEKHQWQQHNRGEQVLKPVATIDIGGMATDMSLSDDGTRLLVLTYLEAMEFDFYVHAGIPAGRPRNIPLRFLLQQEAVAYLPGSRSFIYTSERTFLPAWLMRTDCSR